MTKEALFQGHKSGLMSATPHIIQLVNKLKESNTTIPKDAENNLIKFSRHSQ